MNASGDGSATGSGGLDGNGHGFAVTNVEGDTGDGAVRTHSSSVDLSDDTNHPDADCWVNLQGWIGINQLVEVLGGGDGGR